MQGVKMQNIGILFHPDFNRRLRNLTASTRNGARGLWGIFTQPPVGNLTPPREFYIYLYYIHRQVFVNIK